jgi:hypothetical protein
VRNGKGAALMSFPPVALFWRQLAMNRHAAEQSRDKESQAAVSGNASRG